jgi:prepilin-type N-terminal cleavage/methylation domain-containing protein
MRRRGITLIELMTAMVLSGIVLVSLVSVFATSVQQQLTDGQAREAYETEASFEERVRKYLSHAYLNPDPANQTTFFHGRVLNGASALGSDAADELVFTTIGTGVTGAAANSTETDFAARNQQFGPVGGTNEVSISMTPVGQGGDNQGVFLREQNPSDTDSEQGGYESIMDPDIETVSFEFYDGTDWLGEWDSDSNRSLPRAVRINYTRSGDSDTVHTFVVRLVNEAPAVADQQGGANGQ